MAVILVSFAGCVVGSLVALIVAALIVVVVADSHVGVGLWIVVVVVVVVDLPEEVWLVVMVAVWVDDATDESEARLPGRSERLRQDRRNQYDHVVRFDATLSPLE